MWRLGLPNLIPRAFSTENRRGEGPGDEVVVRLIINRTVTSALARAANFSFETSRDYIKILKQRPHYVGEIWKRILFAGKANRPH